MLVAYVVYNGALPPTYVPTPPPPPFPPVPHRSALHYLPRFVPKIQARTAMIHVQNTSREELQDVANALELA